MPTYRRAYVPGGTFFFTLVTEQRAQFLCTDLARSCLRSTLLACREKWPFQIDALVLLRDHLHTLWTLPEGDSAYPRRWGWIKKEFSKAWLAAGGVEQTISSSRRLRRRRGVLQRGYWEHMIRDEHDLARHFDYIHYNPVKHGLVQSAQDWPFSTFHRWVRQGVYSPEWGSAARPLQFEDLQSSVGE